MILSAGGALIPYLWTGGIGPRGTRPRADPSGQLPLRSMAHLARTYTATPPRRDQLVNQDYTLVEEAQDLAARPLAARLLVVHDAERRREDEVAELARRQ